MQKNTLNRSKNTVSAPYLPYTAYKAFVEGATALNAQIERDAKGATKATFNSVDDAKKFVTNWTANYNANRKVEVAPAPKSTPTKKSTTSKPTATKGKAKTTASSTKKKAPRKAKGNSVDFTQFKGTKSEKNRALHAMLVDMGLKDSRTPEYMAVWSARPWAK